MRKNLFAIALLLFSVAMSQLRASDDGPLYEEAVKEVIALADEAISGSTDVPRPLDGVGGPVDRILSGHIQALDCCRYAFNLTGNRRYAVWCAELLSNYAALYSKLGYHPESRHTAEPGRLFWQVLDDSRWAMYASRTYLEIKSTMPKKQRRVIEDKLFRPMAEFLMYGTADNAKNNFVFNRMHNHGTWQVAAVGMIGFATEDKLLVDKALLGTDLSGRNGGFLQQIDELFSPDGYYMEGVSYQRYALIPYLAFARMLDRYRPELRIFERNSSALAKSADAMFNLAYDAVFFPMNDCDTKSFSSADLVESICCIYEIDPSRKWLLDIVARHSHKVSPDEAGRKLSRDLQAGLAEAYVPKSCKISDGPDGKAGAVMVLRGEAGGTHDGPTVTMKACGQGSYHGHFDKLAISYYDDGNEILTDYGSARYTGMGQKEGGRYTKLNRGYAMTSIAHNTLVVDSTSHYRGITPEAIPHSPRVIAFDGDPSDGLQYMAAVDSTAYEGVRMERWVAMLDLPYLERPLLVDILIADGGNGLHSYDLPYHFRGQMISLNAECHSYTDCLRPAGKDYGYQHLWLEAQAVKDEGTARFSWLCGERIYSLSSAVTASTGISLLRTGANDPTFILRSEPAYMLHREGTGRQIFASCLETHGHYRVEDEIFRDLEASNTGVSVSEGPEGVRISFSFGREELLLSIREGRMEIAR